MKPKKYTEKEQPINKTEGASFSIGRKKSEVPALTSKNAALYIGAIPLPSQLKEFIEAWGYSTPMPLYNEHFFTVALEYFKRHRKEGEPIRIVSCPIFSELFNGKPFIKDSHDFESAKEYMEQIAGKIGLYPDDLEIVAVEEIPAHKDFFDHLKKCIDPKNKKEVVNVRRAYEVEEKTAYNDSGELILPPNPTVLQIAQFLYFVAHKKGNEQFLHKLFDLCPNDSGNNDLYAADKYYGMTEIAIRLHAILQGQNIHAGVERQGVYDDIIDLILRGRIDGTSGWFNELKGIDPLCELFKGKFLGKIHIKAQENASSKKDYLDKKNIFDLKRYRLDILVLASLYIQTSVAVKNIMVATEPQNSSIHTLPCYGVISGSALYIAAEVISRILYPTTYKGKVYPPKSPKDQEYWRSRSKGNTLRNSMKLIALVIMASSYAIDKTMNEYPEPTQENTPDKQIALS